MATIDGVDVPETGGHAIPYVGAATHPRHWPAVDQAAAETIDAALTAVEGGVSELDGDLTALEGRVTATETVANGALQRDGSQAMEGPLNLDDEELVAAELRDYAETLSTVADAGATETLDCQVANVHDVTMTEACTFTLTGWPATGRFGQLTIILHTGGFTPTFTGVDWWINEPAVWADGTYLITVWTVDGGDTTTAVVAGPRVAAA